MGITYGDTDVDTDETTIQLAALTPTDNGVIIGNGAAFVVESGATLKTSLGLTIGTDVQAYAANLTSWAAVAPGRFQLQLVGWPRGFQVMPVTRGCPAQVRPVSRPVLL